MLRPAPVSTASRMSMPSDAMTSPRGGGSSPTNARCSVRPGICAALSGSALIHSTVMGEHLSVWLVAGLFFLALVGIETALALATVYAWGRRTAQAVMMIGIVTVVVWLGSRTTGLPVGPAAFRTPEPVGVPDIASCLLELGAAALAWPCASSAVSGGPRTVLRTPRAFGRWVTACLTIAAIALTAWGVRPALQGEPGHDAPVHGAPS